MPDFFSFRWLSGRVPPVADDSQDAVAIFGQHANGVTRMSFTRKRTTGDSKDFQFTDTSCPYIMYAKGGQLTSSGSITKHQDTPVVSAERVCFKLKQCSSGTTVGRLDPFEYASSPKSDVFCICVRFLEK